MGSFLADGEPSAVLASGVRDGDEPVVLLLHAAGGALMELLGPVFWAALIVTFIHAELMIR